MWECSSIRNLRAGPTSPIHCLKALFQPHCSRRREKRCRTMCGIIGFAGNTEAVPILLDGLERLEYRGYDSAGVAVASPEGRLQVKKLQRPPWRSPGGPGRPEASDRAGGHRPYQMGDPWGAERCKRPSPCEPEREACSGPQWDHRKLSGDPNSLCSIKALCLPLIRITEVICPASGVLL